MQGSRVQVIRNLIVRKSRAGVALAAVLAATAALAAGPSPAWAQAPADAKPADVKPADAKPADAKPAEAAASPAPVVPRPAANAPKPGDPPARAAAPATRTVAASDAGKPPQERRARRPMVKCPSVAGKPYYVEFRARTALSYGHSFVIHGRLGSGSSPATFAVAGLHPAGDDPNVYMAGHFSPVPAETGASDGDLDEQFLSARYCVALSESEYRRAVTVIRRLQSEVKTWHAPTQNCNWFVGEIARGMGLDAPSTGLIYPEVFINSIRSMNNGGTQLPNVPSVQWGGPPRS